MTDKQLTATVEENKETPTSMVVYSDGSARPNPGFVGWGFHGYIYNDIVPKKGSGNTTHFPTGSGYLSKTSKKEGVNKEITPLTYIDGYGCRTEPGSNNLAELLAVKTAIEIAKDKKVSSLLVRTDSEYVRRGIEQFSHGWIKNNWIKADGNPVANNGTWKNVLVDLEDLRSKGCKFKIEWVEGHSDVDHNNLSDRYILGNVLADKLACIGMLNSTSGESRTHITYTQPEGYWKTDINKHPFFSHKRMYFNTLRNSHISGEYYLGDHGKEDDMLGKKMSDGSYAVIQLKQPDPVVEYIRDQQTAITGNEDAIVMVRLDELFKSTTYKYIENYGKCSFTRPNPNRLDLRTIEKEPLTRELRPPMLAMRAIESLSILKAILLDYKAGVQEGYNFIDITDSFYNKETIVKKKETTVKCTLKPNINSAFTSLDTNIKLNDKDCKVIITLGIDMPSRNSLKSIESENIKVILVTWKQSDEAYRFAVILDNGEDYGIWAGFYSNIIFCKK